MRTMKLQSINPATEELLAEFDPLSEDGIETLREQSAAMRTIWRTEPVSERAALLTRVSGFLRPHVGAANDVYLKSA